LSKCYGKGGEIKAVGELADAIYDLVKGLLERGVPIHGVGLQMHISLESSEWFESAVSSCC